MKESEENNNFEDNEFTYECEFAKVEESTDGDLYIYGLATSEKVDYDNEIVDLNEVRGVWDEYMRNPVLKFMHGRDPHNMSAIGKVVDQYVDHEGKTWKTEFTERGPMIVAKLSNAPDTESIRVKVREGTLKALSIGGRARRVKIFDPTLQKDINRVITTRISEVSLVDLPANSDTYVTVLKAACTGPNCPLNDDTEPIEKVDDPIVTEAVTKFEEIITENDQLHLEVEGMKEKMEKLESKIQDMTTANDPNTIMKGEENESTEIEDNNISTIIKDDAGVDDQIGGNNMENEDGIVRMEVPELEEFIKGTVEKMVGEQETIEKLEDYDRLVAEIKDMRTKIANLEAQAIKNVKALAEGKETTYKSENEVEDVETVEKAAKKKKDEEPEKKYDDEGNEILEEADMKIKKMEAEIKALKESPLYKAQQDGITVEKAEMTEPTGVLAGIISQHYGGN